MILVGSSAVGFALVRWILPHSTGRGWYPSIRGVCSPILACWTVAVLSLRLRGPRPRLRRLLRQPGAVSCLASAANIAIWAVFLAIKASRNGSATPEVASYVGLISGAGVIGAWLALGSTATMRRERGWIDGIGMAIGAGWILVMLLILWEIIPR